MIKNTVRNRRLGRVIYFFLAAMVVIVLRLAYLQIGRGAEFFGLGERNFIRLETIAPLRGNLYDCHNVLLASNRPVYDLYWQGTGGRGMSADDWKVVYELHETYLLSLLTDEKKQAIALAGRYARRILLQADIPFEVLCKISEHFGQCSSLIISNRFDRVYPHASFASHVLGYLSRSEKIGRSGVERVLQGALQGQLGYVKQVINSTGKCLSQQEYHEAVAGQDVVLTLDFQMQTIAERIFEKDQTGAFIVMDAKTGAVRVLLSYPNFDPNAFLQPITEQAWHEKMTINNPLLNRATCSLYPPASTFKLVTVAAALEEKIVEPTSTYFCHGYVEFGGRKYACMRRIGHGEISLKNALVKSCNAYMYELAKRIHVDRLAVYAKRFGFGDKTNFLLPEQVGLVPTMAWKLSTYGERIWKGEMLSIAIGQGFLTVTPLQVVRMVASICSGNLVRPRLLESEPIVAESVAFSSSTLHFLKDAMKEVATSGTARLLADIAQVQVYAKTGTAQTCSLDKAKTSKDQLEHAWITGFFSHKKGGPEYAFVAMVEHVGSSRPAVELVKRFLQAYDELCVQQPEYCSSTKKKERDERA